MVRVRISDAAPLFNHSTNGYEYASL